MIIAMRGRTDNTDSTLPLFIVLVLSVTEALKAASFAVLPKKVMMQSIATIKQPDKKILLLTIIVILFFGSKKAKRMMEIPQMI